MKYKIGDCVIINKKGNEYLYTYTGSIGFITKILTGKEYEINFITITGLVCDNIIFTIHEKYIDLYNLF